MGLMSLLFFTLILIGLYVVFLYAIVAYRKIITVMMGMMVAMSLGMTVGLMSGAILGVYLPGQFFYSAMIAMLIGLTIGFSAGLPISIMAVIDGMLSGLMGGMMGAMLGVMVEPQFQAKMLNILFVIITGVLLLLLYMIHKEAAQSGQQTIWIQKPILLGMVLLILFLLFNILDPYDSIQRGKRSEDLHNHQT